MCGIKPAVGSEETGRWTASILLPPPRGESGERGSERGGSDCCGFGSVSTQLMSFMGRILFLRRKQQRQHSTRPPRTVELAKSQQVKLKRTRTSTF